MGCQDSKFINTLNNCTPLKQFYIGQEYYDGPWSIQDYKKAFSLFFYSAKYRYLSCYLFILFVNNI